MNSPIFQILMLLTVILVGIMTVVLFAVQRANRQIPGLRAWAHSYLCGLLLCVSFLIRPYLPEWPSILISQVLLFSAAWLNLVAAQLHTGRRPWSWASLGWTLLPILGLSSYLSWPQPEPELRLALILGAGGTLMLLSARTMLSAEIRRQPERYMFTLACGTHGLSMLATSLVLLLGQVQSNEPEWLDLVAQFVAIESIVVLVMRAFGIVMLANAHITAELRHFAERDPLTSIYNRRSFLILLDKSVNLMRRMNSPLSLLALDLDHFKRINDNWGHGVGDQALRHFVRLTSEHLRNEDVIGRIGGEEFLIFLPNTGLEAAACVAERLRALLESQPVAAAQGPIPLTVSIGVTLVARDESRDAALQRVDEAMYRAKTHGRNRVEMATAPTERT